MESILPTMKGQGKGLFTTQAFAKGQHLCDYPGNLMTKQTADNQSGLYKQLADRNGQGENWMDCYILFFTYRCEQQFAIDPGQTPYAFGHYANHADTTPFSIQHELPSPNSKLKRPIFPATTAYLVATRNISAGEEVLWCYNDFSFMSFPSKVNVL